MQKIASNMKTTSTHKAFIARALASRDEAKLSGEYFASAEVLIELNRMLIEAETKCGRNEIPYSIA
jgi:hypothetical protein